MEVLLSWHNVKCHMNLVDFARASSQYIILNFYISPYKDIGLYNGLSE